MSAAIFQSRTAVGAAAIYAAVSTPFFALWELAQLPLYTIWRDGGVAASIAAALHCTVGDAGLAFVSMLAAFGFGAVLPMLRSFKSAAAMIVLFGVGATAVIEFMSITLLQRWEYSALMPVDPLFGIGISPLAQWIVVPILSLFLVRRRLHRALAQFGRSTRPRETNGRTSRS